MSSNLIRWSGLAAMLGGALLIVWASVVASKPRGCIAEECAYRPMREFGAFDSILSLLALLLLVVGVVGVVIRTREAGRFGRLGSMGLIMGACGGALVLTSNLVQAIFFGGDFPLMPYLFIPGVLALVAGFLLLGIVILRAKVMPNWVAVLLILGTLAMFGMNMETARVLLTIPLGVAWVGVGYVFWSGRGTAAQQPSRVS